MKFRLAIQWWLAGAAASGGQVWATAKEERRARDVLKEKAFNVLRRLLHSQDSQKTSHPQHQRKSSSHRSETTVWWDSKRLIPIHEKDSAFAPSPQAIKEEQLTNGRLLDGKKAGRRAKNGSKRRVKGESKKGAGKSTKSAKDALKIIQKRSKGEDGEAGSDFLCFQGTYQDVAAACDLYNAECCVGEEACAWMNDPTRPTTICQGACAGKAACKDIAPGSYVGPNACRQDYSCSYLAYSSTQSDTIEIGKGSCNGEAACSGICFTSNYCKVEIGSFACIGVSACKAQGYYSPRTEKIGIGSDACQDDFACDSISMQNSRLEEIDIGSGACNSLQSCQEIAKLGRAPTIKVGPDSCKKPASCEGLGVGAADIDIGTYSCLGYDACYRLGYFSLNDIKIRDGTCTGDFSCSNVGEGTTFSVVIDQGACTNTNSCLGVGKQVSQSTIVIGKNACSETDDQCSGQVDSHCYYTTVLPRNAQSCRA